MLEEEDVSGGGSVGAWGVLMGLCILGGERRRQGVGMIDGRRVVSAYMCKRREGDYTTRRVETVMNS